MTRPRQFMDDPPASVRRCRRWWPWHKWTVGFGVDHGAIVISVTSYRYCSRCGAIDFADVDQFDRDVVPLHPATTEASEPNVLSVVPQESPTNCAEALADA